MTSESATVEHPLFNPRKHDNATSQNSSNTTPQLGGASQVKDSANKRSTSRDQDRNQKILRIQEMETNNMTSDIFQHGMHGTLSSSQILPDQLPD